MALNVLVVDDSAVMRSVIVKMLRLLGGSLGEVYEAANGREALAVLQAHPVSVALVDINMPVMDGEEFLNRVRNDPASAHLPIVIVSTEGSETRIERLKNLGAEFVHKPFSPERLRESMQRATGAF
jgi:two-component system chemotaxis response regulator CheY